MNEAKPFRRSFTVWILLNLGNKCIVDGFAEIQSRRVFLVDSCRTNEERRDCQIVGKNRRTMIRRRKPGVSGGCRKMRENAENVSDRWNKGAREFSIDDVLNRIDKETRGEKWLSRNVPELSDQTVSTRRLFMSSALMAAGLSVNMPSPAFAGSDLPESLRYKKSPVNKRSGVTVFDAEKFGYNVQFVTYLSRFLLCFDIDCQRWWYTRAADIPRMATEDEVEMMRLRQFGAFSASVEVGLIEYSNPADGGPRRLMKSLLERYCPDPDVLERTLQEERIKRGLPPANEAFIERERREIEEARRQIALLFGLMKQSQPVEEITKLLAAIDNGSITSVLVENQGSGYAPGYGAPLVTFPPPEAGEDYVRATGRAVLCPNGQILRIDLINRGVGYLKPPTVLISPPSARDSVTISPDNSSIPVKPAKAKAYIFRNGPNKGRIQRIQLLSPGSGYTPLDDIKIKISAADSKEGQTATAKAILEYEVCDIKITNPGSGYAVERPIQVQVEPPPLTARVNMNDPMLAGIIPPDQPLPLTSIPSASTKKEKGSTLIVTAKLDAIAGNGGQGGGGGCIGRACYDQSVVVKAIPTAERNSYESFRSEDAEAKLESVEVAVQKRSFKSSNSENSNKEASLVSATSSGKGDIIPPSLPFWAGGPSSSSSLLSLLPSGIGLEYNDKLKRYTLARGADFEKLIEAYSTPGTDDSVTGAVLLSNKPLDPEFGPRGRSPIERDRILDAQTLLRFCASGAICCSAVHLALTPIDVVKTKVQTNPKKYPGVISAFGTVTAEEGFVTFFTGWAPTFVGFFINGGISYTVTEFMRRYLTDRVVEGGILGGSAVQLEVPIILASASISAFTGSFALAPFESVRIRSVSQPGYADNILGVVQRMVKEEGIGSLFNAVPAFILKEIPFACGKFTVFDLSTEWMYDHFPAAREDIQLSLLVSLIGGTLGGICAAIVSNPADATISEMKKAKSDIGFVGSAQGLLQRDGPSALFRGLALRMFFYSLVVSFQFLIYDAVRFSLGIGSDDLKLYLDVLGGALGESGGPV